MLLSVLIKSAVIVLITITGRQRIRRELIGGLTMARYRNTGRVMYSKKDYKKQDIQEAYTQLIKMLDRMPSDGYGKSAIYVTIRKVTNDGMGRYMSFHIIQFSPSTGRITLVDVTYWIASCLLYTSPSPRDS